MNFENMELGTKIKDLRSQKGFTQDYVADKLGISQPAYSKIESGHIEITINRLIEICKILDVNMKELV